MATPAGVDEICIRVERPGDVATIQRITEQAFAQVPHASGSEARIIDNLREAGVLLSWIAESAEDGVIGQVSLSPVWIGDSSEGWFGLGPIAVDPQYQRRGVGSRLVEAATSYLRSIGACGCILIGDPGWYRRFGFHPAPDMRFAEVSAPWLMVLPFVEDWPRGEVHYHPAFMSALA